MQVRQAAYLVDILRSAETIQRYIEGCGRDDFLRDMKTQDAVLRRLLVIGEAAARLTPETVARFENLPFRRMAGLRNRAVHEYGQIDFEIIWDTSTFIWVKSSAISKPGWMRKAPEARKDLAEGHTLLVDRQVQEQLRAGESACPTKILLLFCGFENCVERRCVFQLRRRAFERPDVGVDILRLFVRKRLVAEVRH